MPAPTKRRVPLYCVLISSGPLVMVKMPDTFVRWDIIRREIHASIKREHDIKAKDVVTIEGMAGMPEGVNTYEEGFERFERAFNGDVECYPKFNLHAWNDEEQTFKLFRSAIISE